MAGRILGEALPRRCYATPRVLGQLDVNPEKCSSYVLPSERLNTDEVMTTVSQFMLLIKNALRSVRSVFTL